MLKPSPKAEMSPSVIIIDNQKLSKVTWTATSRSYILIYNMEYLRVRSQFTQDKTVTRENHDKYHK